MRPSTLLFMGVLDIVQGSGRICTCVEVFVIHHPYIVDKHTMRKEKEKEKGRDIQATLHTITACIARKYITDTG